MKSCEIIVIVIATCVMTTLCIVSMFCMIAWINSPNEFVFKVEIEMDNKTYQSVSELIELVNHHTQIANLTNDQLVNLINGKGLK